MGTEQQTISARVSADRRAAVERYREAANHDSLSDAADELIGVGLREKRAPLLSRLRDQAVDAAYHLVLVAVVVVITGAFTTALGPVDAIHIALTLLAVAVGPLALVELARVVTGQSELADLRGRWSA